MVNDNPENMQIHDGGLSSDYLNETATHRELLAGFGAGKIGQVELYDGLAVPIASYAERFVETNILANSNADAVIKINTLVEEYNSLAPEVKADKILHDRFQRKLRCLIEDKIYGDYKFEFEGVPMTPTEVHLYQRSVLRDLELVSRGGGGLDEFALPVIVHNTVMNVLGERGAKPGESYVAREMREAGEIYQTRCNLETKDLCSVQVLDDGGIVITGEYSE